MSREFSIDMIPGGTQTAVHCNQFESGDTWDFALYYNGGRYTIPEDAEVSITGTKPDGAAYKVDGEVVNNAVRIEVTEQMTAAAGKTTAEILVVSETDGTTLYSANFPVIVEPAAVQADLNPSEIPTAIVGPDGTIYYSEEAVISEGVTSEVRQALYTLLNSAAYAQTGLTDEIAIIQSWAQQITAISVSPTTASITGTGTSQLTATTTPAGGTVTWSSSDTSVATVSSSGLVTGVGNGSCTITASAGGKSATCAVTVSGFVMYSITNNLTNTTNSNGATSIASGGAYTGVISVTSDYYDLGTVTITMGGTDITSTAYDDGNISIASVTGNVVITASGVGGLYAIDNGTHNFTSGTKTGSVVVSNDNHVKVTKTGSYTSTTNYVSLNPLSGNTADIYNSNNALAGDLTDPIFTLSANDVVKFVWANIELSGVTKLSTMLKGSSGNVATTGSLAVTSSSGTIETTVTVATGGDVVKISSYVEAGAASAENPKYIEYDLKIYVNGVRYI